MTRMQNNEVVEILKYHIKKTNNVEDITAFTHAIKCVELAPELVEALSEARYYLDRLHDDGDMNHFEDDVIRYGKILDKAKELIE